ncbi:hypothetical protein Hanom_Chr04g00383501 [Helianthus anomalus]
MGQEIIAVATPATAAAQPPPPPTSLAPGFRFHLTDEKHGSRNHRRCRSHLGSGFITADVATPATV